MEEFAEINITPFTDVLLVLLVIFMVMAALIAPAGFERKLPNCNCTHRAAFVPPPKAELVIARDGKMSLAGQLVDVRSIYPAMAALHARHTNVALAIYGDRETAYAYIVRAMDAAKSAHITDVSFITM